jgi:mono/diheme cytochrome c family protein
MLHRALIAFVLLTTPAAAADPAQGHALAKRWCAECHVVAPDQTTAKVDAPPFATISATRRAGEITTFLQQTHANMPDMTLSRSEIADLIAWMQSLAPPLEPLRPPPQKDDYKAPSRG